MAIVANQGDIEVEWNAGDIEGRLSAKDIAAWKDEVANYVRSYIFPRKQWVKDKEIGWGSEMQKLICKMTLKRFPNKWEEFWDEQGGMEVVRKTIGRRRQSSADGQKKNFQSRYHDVWMKQFDVVNLMSGLQCKTEWMEGANRNGRNGTEQIPEPPTPDILERDMRKDRKQYIQFVVRMLPPVYGKEIWNDMAEKTKLSEFVTASQEAFALLLYKNGFESWSWMLSDSSSSSDGDGIETQTRPAFKYTSRSEEHVMMRNCGWTVEGLNAFNTLYALVTEDRKEYGNGFDDALLKYYEEKNNKKRRKAPNEERGKRARLEISDDLAGLFAEALGGDDQSTDEEESTDVAV